MKAVVAQQREAANLRAESPPFVQPAKRIRASRKAHHSKRSSSTQNYLQVEDQYLDFSSSTTSQTKSFELSSKSAKTEEYQLEPKSKIDGNFVVLFLFFVVLIFFF